MKKSSVKPDAIVFIPGNFKPWEGSIVGGLGERLAVALERNNPPKLRFHTNKTTAFPNPAGVTEVVKVSVSPGANRKSKPLIDLYCLDLVDVVTEPYRVASALKKACYLGFHIVTLTPKTVSSFFRRNLSLRGKLQIIFCGAVILLMQLSFFTIIATLIAGFTSLTPATTDTLDKLVNWALPFAGAFLAALAMLPQRIRSALDSFTAFVLSFIGYLSAGSGRDAAIGKLASFLESLAENCDYQRVHIASFGIGTIIALDSLFPREQPILRFKMVDTLITIACPADIILHYYPQYFKDRQRLRGIPKRWVNAFVPSDLLASNFIEGDSYNETPKEQTYKGILGKLGKLRNQSWSGISVCGQNKVTHPNFNIRHALTSAKGAVNRVFASVRAHQSYWSRTNVTSASIFDAIVQKLFPA
ncbi:hypothetical protein ES703_60048 [subsurface metagenome]